MHMYTYEASSLIVLVSFTWGIFIFQEPIHSQFGASVAILSMILGLIGMSYYSSPSIPQQPVVYAEVVTAAEEEDNSDLNDIQATPKHFSDNDVEISMHATHRSTITNSGNGSQHRNIEGDCENVSAPVHEMEDDTSSVRIVAIDDAQLHDHEIIRHVVICGYVVSKRHLGMLSAAFCGLWGGSIMAPMKFCSADTKGTHYLLSFSIGASIVNIVLWMLRYLYNVIQYQSFYDAYKNLPSFHLRKMWLAGGTSGILWSIGNFFSLISVFYLGEGVGYPLVQTSILISGLWGLFYFKEVQGTHRICKWLMSSLLTVFGILLLSYEHHVK
jgi:Transmembrane family, TMEM144 of transporters